MTHFAREYGNALFELAKEEDLLKEFLEQIGELCDYFRSEPDYIRLMCTRSIDPEERKALLDQAFSGQVHPFILNFMKLLTGRGAMEYFFECAEVYRSRYDEFFGLIEAEVISAVELTEAQLKAIVEKMEAITGRKLSVKTSVDPYWIGGVRVVIEGRRYDNTVRTRLRHIRRSLIQSE